jgi:hypothetical protein
MRKINNYIFLLILCQAFFSGGVQAQFYSAGQDPASIKWMQIQTDHFQVIFPQGYEEQASYITDLLQWSYENVSQSLEHQPRKVSVIVHTHTTVSNGFVSWAPRRIELYATPPSDNDFHHWMERLVVHEFRHIVQIDKLNQGLTRLLGILFGEMGTGAVVGHIPLWFMEGDAVVTETVFTRAGRGRLPVFEQGLRAQVLNQGIHSYSKARFGSYKDFVPNYYELGYQLVAAARVKYGPNIFSPVINNVARRPLTLIPFSGEIKRQFGYSQSQHYKRTFGLLDSLWRIQYNNHSYTPSEAINQKPKLFTSYLYPHWINDSTLVALKKGLKDIPSVIKTDKKGNETILFKPGYVYPNSLHATEAKVVWSQLRPDPRWEHRNFAEIITYDLSTGERKRISDKGKFFSPALSPDGLKVATVEVTYENLYSLVILDANSGKELWRFNYPDNDFIMQPAWHKSGEKIVVVALNDQGKKLDEIYLDSKARNTRLQVNNVDVSTPVYIENDLIFHGTWSGIDNLYILREGNTEPLIFVSSEYGAVNPSVNPSFDQLAYSSYTDMGYQLKTMSLANGENIPLSSVNNHSFAFYKTLEKQEEGIAEPKQVEQNTYTIKRYSRIANLFHLHSWFPAYLDIDNIEVNPGASLLFQNKLSTSFATLGYSWDLNSETGKYAASYIYNGWYPVLELSAETGNRRLYYNADNEDRNFLWRQNEVNLAISLPLSSQYNEYFIGINPQLSLGFTQATQSNQTPDSIYAGNSSYVSLKETNFYTQGYRVYAYNQRRSVERDIYPRFAQTVEFQYKHTPWQGADMGSIVAMRGALFLPSFIRHHGIRLSAALQRKERGENNREQGTYSIFFNFGDVIAYPRGMIHQNHQYLTAFTADYTLPLWYPDLNIPHVVYIKRFRANLFYDFAYAQQFPSELNRAGLNENFYSYGIGLTSDLHLFGFVAPFSLGVQMSLPNGDDPVFRFIYSTGL